MLIAVLDFNVKNTKFNTENNRWFFKMLLKIKGFI